MNDNEYDALLNKLLEGTATPAEEDLLRQHEASCPACADRHQAAATLLDQLDSLCDDVPPMPEDFHSGWMKRVEDCAMENHQEAKNIRKPHHSKTWTRLLSVAAALVFIVGGTLLTRDALNPLQYTLQSTDDDDYLTADSSDTGAGSSMARTANYSTTLENSESADMATYTEDALPAAEVKKIIRTVDIAFATQHYDDSLAAIKEACTGAGGWIERINESVSSSGSRHTASMTLRIPADQLDSFLTSLDGAGRVTRRSETATDVTADYQDTQARLKTQQALMERLQSLVTTAADLSDLLALESQIADTQYTIDRLQASLNVTDRQVDYATVDVTLKEEAPSEAAQSAELTLGQRIGNALSGGWNAFAEFLSDAAVFLVAALPFLAALAVIALVIRLIVRQKRKHTKG